MKILVGVMHCIENELDQCLTAINSQTAPAYDQFLISKLPNKEAHDRLYRTFMDRSDEADLFVKIDADMVLSRPTFFEELVARFKRDPELLHLQIALHDWFTDRPIFGLHAYRSCYRWKQSIESHFVDMVGEDAQPCVNDPDELAPAAVHCPDPSAFQAFHFGLHKAVKVLQKDRSERHLAFACTHWGHFASLEDHAFRNDDKRLALARCGFLHAIVNHFGPEEVDFHSRRTTNAFDAYKNLDLAELRSAASKLGPVAWRILPHGLRFEFADHIARSGTGLGDFLRIFNRWRLGRFDQYRLN